MKNMRRITAILVVILLVVCFGSVAYADSPTTGKITVTNAEMGKSYDAYKIFDATYLTDASGNTSAAYYSKSNNALAAYIKTNPDGCPFEIVGTPVGDTYYFQVKTGKTAKNIGDWLISDDVKGKWMTDTNKITATCSAGNTAVFLSVPFGYYIMYPGSGTVFSLNTNTPDVNIIDKHERVPGVPTKALTGDKHVAVGQDVTFTTSFSAVNFITASDQAEKSNIVEEYRVVDTYEEGLTYKQIDSIVLTYEDKSIATLTTGDYSVQWNATSRKMVVSIPWVNKTETDMASLYKSPCTVTITYTMTVDKYILDDKKLQAVNTAEEYYVIEDTTAATKLTDYDADGVPAEHQKGKTTPLVPFDSTNKAFFKSVGDDEADVITTGVSITKKEKTDDTSTLEGAKFILWKGTTGSEQYYSFDETTGTITWMSSVDDADRVVADNDDATMEFKGLTPGTYYLYETTAPSGYNISGQAITLVIGTDATDPDIFTMTVNGGAAQQAGPKFDSPYFKITVENNKGTLLPGTGGPGTVIIIAVGAALVVTAVIILVARKKTRKSNG